MMQKKNWLYRLQQWVTTNPWLYGLVIAINILGVVWGFFWYQHQLSNTPPQFWIFTPDCPGAALLFLIWVTLVALKFPRKTFRVIAITALIKYGIWTVTVIGMAWIDQGIHYWQNVMLFVSHLGMILEGVVFAARMKISRLALVITSFWLLLNDFVDYYFGVYPTLPQPGKLILIRNGTVLLSVSIILWMWYVNKKQRDATTLT